MCNDTWQQIMIRLKYDTLIAHPNKLTKVIWISKGISNKSEDDDEHLKELALTLNPLSIKYFKNPSFDLQFLSIYQNINNIRLIEQPDPRIQKLAIDLDVSNISLIKQPHPRIQKLIIDRKLNNINYIQEPTLFFAIQKCIKVQPIYVESLAT